MATDLSIDNRRGKAAELLATQGFMSLAELVQNLDVSESTVRRDLEILEEQGAIRRTYGGAVYTKSSSPAHSLAYADRETTAAAEKHAIAQTVAQLIPEGQTVILNGGTTCFQVATELKGRRLSVITNSVPIASVLSSDIPTEVTLIGGYVYPRTGVALGTMAEQQLDMLHAGQVVMSCAGVTEQGAFNANQMMVGVERKMMRIADEVILAVDHTKFGMRSVVKLCNFDEVDIIVTDEAVGPETKAWLDSLKAKVIYAGLAK